MRALFRLLVTAALLLPLLVSCRKKEPEPPPEPTVVYREPVRASIAGKIAVPEGLNRFGVMVFAEGTGHASFTDSEGSFLLSNLPEGTFSLRAARTDLESALVGVVTVRPQDLDTAQPFMTLEPVTLDAVEGARGTATGDRGVAVLRGRVVTTVPADAAMVMVSLGGSDQRTVTDPQGRFVFYGLDPGTWQLRFERDQYTPTSLIVEVAAGQEVDAGDVRLLPVDSGSATRTIYGQVTLLSEEGPAADFTTARVFLEGTAHAVTPDQQGRYQLDRIPPGNYIVSATAAGYLLEERFSVEMYDVPAMEVNLTLLAAQEGAGKLARLYGRVVLGDGSEDPGGVAVALAGTQLIAYTNRQGEYVLNDVELGDYELIAVKAGWRTGTIEDLRIEEATDYEVDDLVLERDVEPPAVAFTEPTNGARGVAIEPETFVTISFTKPMDPSSVRAAVSITPEVEFTYESMRRDPAGRPRATTSGQDTFTLVLSGYSTTGKSLRYNTRYTVTVDASAADVEGTPMEESHSFNFTTGGARVIATVPENDAKDFLPYFNSPVQVLFNAPIEEGTIQSSHVEITPRPFVQPTIRFRRDRRTGWTTLLIEGRWDYDTEYRIRLNRGASTISRDRVENLPYTFRFRTPKPHDGMEQFGIEDGERRTDDERRRRRNN